jgi:hypothetical protein
MLKWNSKEWAVYLLKLWGPFLSENKKGGNRCSLNDLCCDPGKVRSASSIVSKRVLNWPMNTHR